MAAQQIVSCFVVDYEFSPGIKFSVTPQNFDIRKFYPYNKDVKTVIIKLDDGEKRMDECLFKFLYHISDSRFSTESKNDNREGSSSSSEEFTIPFTVKQFKEYLLVLMSRHKISKLRKSKPNCFLSYFLITHFLVPKKEELYGLDLIPDNFLDRLDLDLDLIPKKVALRILLKSRIWKKANDQKVVKIIVNNLEYFLYEIGQSRILKFLTKAVPTIRELGLDDAEILKTAIDTLYAQETESVEYSDSDVDMDEYDSE